MTQHLKIIDVHMPGLICADAKQLRCALGPAGIVSQKTEGDGATPAGIFSLRRVLYRPDRIEKPTTGLNVHALTEKNIWCDDPQHPDYNCLASLPMDASHEQMWREDHLYDIVVEVGYNDDPPIPGKGSAIFMHVAREGYTPTQGCVAMKIEDLLSVLTLCDTTTVLRINLPE